MKVEVQRLVLFSLFTVLLSFAALELLLRTAAFIGVVDLSPPVTVRDVWAREGWAVDRHLNWKLLPNHTSKPGNAEYRTNSLGLREDEISAVKPPDTFRILMLGDSTVFGFGILYGERYSDLLERMLTSDAPETRFEVINAGVPGYSIYNCREYLERNGMELDPDLIVLQTNFNDRRYILSKKYEDGEDFYRGFYYRLRVSEVLGASFIYRGMKKLTVDILGFSARNLVDTGEFQYEQIDIENVRCRIEPERYRSILDDLIDFCLKRDVRVILVPLRDRPAYVNDYYMACSLAASGRYREAIPLLQKMFALPFYRVIVAKKYNELLDRSGDQAKRMRHIKVPAEWMSTDGNIPIYLCDPYVEIMNEAGLREGVVTLSMSPFLNSREELYMDYIHLNEKGHRTIADQLFRALREERELAVPF